MLRIHVVRQGGEGYYVSDLVPGRAEGTQVAGESPGVWTGTASPSLGLAGTVEAVDFGEVLGGRDPRSGANLRMARGERSVAAYDLTFCAPKSVSLLHLLAPPEMASETGRGHLAAVADAAAYLERAAAGVRRTRAGTTAYLPATGFVAGSFVHRTSRSLDPHLHTHLVVANVAEGVDGTWSAMDSRRVFAHARATRALYHARLRLELGKGLGATWAVQPSGLGDVVGVDATLRRVFSRRSAAIDERTFRLGRSSSLVSTQIASHATRPEKDREVTVDALMAEWKRRATDFGFDLGNLTRVIGRKRDVAEPPILDGDRIVDRLQRLAERRPWLAGHDVVAVIAEASPAGAEARLVEQLARKVVDATESWSRERPRGEALRAEGHRGEAWCGRREPDGRAQPRWRAEDLARVVRTEAGVLSVTEPDGDLWRSGSSTAPQRGRSISSPRTLPPTDRAAEGRVGRGHLRPELGLVRER